MWVDLKPAFGYRYLIGQDTCVQDASACIKFRIFTSGPIMQRLEESLRRALQVNQRHQLKHDLFSKELRVWPVYYFIHDGSPQGQCEGTVLDPRIIHSFLQTLQDKEHTKRRAQASWVCNFQKLLSWILDPKMTEVQPIDRNKYIEAIWNQRPVQILAIYVS